MATDRLDRYMWEAEAHANELLELFDLETRESHLPWAEEHWSQILQLVFSRPQEALIFLGEGPTARDRRLAKLEAGHDMVLWVQARFLALEAANVLRAAECAATIPQRSSYRKAVRHVAQASLSLRGQANAEEVMLLELPV